MQQRRPWLGNHLLNTKMDRNAAIPFFKKKQPNQSSAKVGKGSGLLNKCVCQGWIFFFASFPKCPSPAEEGEGTCSLKPFPYGNRKHRKNSILCHSPAALTDASKTKAPKTCWPVGAGGLERVSPPGQPCSTPSIIKCPP